MKISNKRSNKTTNEKPVKIPLDFKDAVAALLKVKPPPKEKPKEQDEQEQKKPSD